MNNEGKKLNKELNVRVIVLVTLSIIVFIWTMLYFFDKPNPKLNEDVPIQIGLNQPQTGVLWIGADLEDLTPAIVSKYELHTDTGLFVRKVLPGSPAEKAGLMDGDVIVSIDKIKIKNSSDLDQVLSGQKAGSRLKFRILRDNRSKSYNIVLEQKTTQDATKLKTKTKTVVEQTNDAWIGVDVQSVDSVIIRQLKLPDSSGVLVSYVVPGSPAAENGLMRGDVILKVNKAKVTDPLAFQEILSAKKPGDTVKLEIFRAGFNQEIILTTANMPATANNRPGATIPPAEVEVEAAWLAMTVVPLDPVEAKELGLPSGSKGMVVDAVSAGPGFDAGFLIGDIIVSINGMPTTTLKEFKDATEAATGAMVDVIRSGRHRYVTVASPGFDKQGNPLANNLPLTQAALNSPINTKGLKVVAVPAMGQDASSRISPSFSKSPYIVFVDLDTNAVNAVVNVDNGATGILTARSLVQQKADTVITGRIGPRAFDSLNGAKVTVYAGTFGSVSDAIQALREGKLTPSVTVRGSATAGGAN